MSKSYPARCLGFSLPSLLISIAVFLMVVSAIVASHLFGLRMFELSQIKLGASGNIAECFNPIVTDLQTVKRVRVGTGDDRAFTEVSASAPQQGNALQIYPTSDTNVFVRFFVDPRDSKFKRRAPDGKLTVIAEMVTNTIAFTLENLQGQVLTNRLNRSVIGVSLRFSGFKDSRLRVGTNNYFTGYGVETKIANRAPD